MRKPWHIIPLLLLLLATIRCKRDYNPPVLQNNPNFLVVDGFINAGANSTTAFTLSRTQGLNDSAGAYTPELQAEVTILGSNGTSITLQDLGNGTYTSPQMTLDPGQKYKLLITTRNGSKYTSDTVSTRISPPIDSLSWRQDDSSGNVIVSANTHDPANNSHYYRWFYTETWKYHAPLQSELQLINGQIYYAIDSLTQEYLIYYCWRSDKSTDIVLGNTTSFSQDRVSQQPIGTVPRGAQKLSIKYSMLASQYVLTPDAYQYWLILQKNTQNLGSLFDPQPSQLAGNIHCLTNPKEPVIGYLSASSIQQQRLFIDNSQVRNWDSLQLECPLRQTGWDPNNFHTYNYPDTLWGPYYFSGPALILTKRDCLDCRLQGGTLTKPSFWPN
jgi:hypothetical protein